MTGIRSAVNFRIGSRTRINIEFFRRKLTAIRFFQNLNIDSSGRHWQPLAMNTKQIERSETDTAKSAAPIIAAEYMKPVELAQELGVSLRSLARWHAERTGPPRTVIGRVILFRREAVAAWLLTRERSEPRAPRGLRTH
jgi:hypothetical protein